MEDITFKLSYKGCENLLLKVIDFDQQTFKGHAIIIKKEEQQCCKQS